MNGDIQMKKIIFGLCAITLGFSQSADAISLTQPVLFDNDTIGIYDKYEFYADWNMYPSSSSGQKNGRLYIVPKSNASTDIVMRVMYLANQVGGNSGMVFTPTIGESSTNQYTHLYFQYKVKFESSFTWVKGGKLPGLTSSPDSPTGCVAGDTYDGFSARLMWRESGVAASYLYLPDKVNECGTYFYLYNQDGTQFHFNKGQWYTLTQEIRLNDVNGTQVINNGILKEWIDDQQMFFELSDKTLVPELTNLVFRNSNTIYIDQIKMDTFFGGSTSDWAPAESQFSYFDAFRVSESMPSLK